jgi:hypothetical protein
MLGLFVEADGGTLFFDEIGDLDVSLQVKPCARSRAARSSLSGPMRRVDAADPGDPPAAAGDDRRRHVSR